jgi:hypothetical protein
MAVDFPYKDGDILQFNIVGDLHEQTTITTFHYQVSAFDNTAIYDLGGALPVFSDEVWAGLAGGGMADCCSHELSGVLVVGQNIYPTRYRAFPYQPAATSGTVATACNSTGVSVVVKRVGREAKKSNQGRVYIPGIPDASCLAGELAPAARAPFGTFSTELLTVLEVQPPPDYVHLQPVLFNASDPTHPVAIVGSTVTTTLRYQRRRELRVGA